MILQVPDTVYMWPMVAFATAILLNLLSMAFESRPVKRQLCFLVRLTCLARGAGRG